MVPTAAYWNLELQLALLTTMTQRGCYCALHCCSCMTGRPPTVDYRDVADSYHWLQLPAKRNTVGLFIY
jgi:hypothetical protein